MKAHLKIMLATALLQDCGGGGSNPVLAADCAAITGGGTTVTETGTCSACTVQAPGSAADGNTGSFATLLHPTGAGGANSLRVTAQEGVVYPAGTPATVINSVDYEGSSVSTSLTLQTYLDGVPQESTNVGTINGVGGPDEELRRRGFNTSLPFDALEISFQRASGAGTVAVNVHEFCTNF